MANCSGRTSGEEVIVVALFPFKEDTEWLRIKGVALPGYPLSYL